MKSYTYEPAEEDDLTNYKQDLGFRKMLYKYQHENDLLRNQIKALTQRLEAILADKSSEDNAQKQKNTSSQKYPESQIKYLTQQMNHWYNRRQSLNNKINHYKNTIDQTKDQQHTTLTNTLKDKQQILQSLKSTLNKYKEDTTSKQSPLQTVPSGIVEGTNEELEIKYTNQLNQLKKRIKELQKIKYGNQKLDINKHRDIVSLEVRTRKIGSGELGKREQGDREVSSSGKKGLWGLDLTQENYKKISEDLQFLKKEKTNLLESIKIENNGLRQQLVKLKNQYIDISAQNVRNSVDITQKILKTTSTPKQKLQQSIILPDIPVAVGNSAYQRKNDKNFIQKKTNLLEWNPTKGKKTSPGFSWNDQNNKSPITGINFWFEKSLIGIQFIHTLGETIQHIHAEGGTQAKKLVPIQYRLNSNDYLENVVLVVGKSQNSILGVELVSKNGRKDSFGLKVGSPGTEKFDFGISAPQKPIYSFGSFLINPNTHLSNILTLGFATI